MYRWLLCFRYLRTRYIALASIISVTLGVATLIVVNSVMAGFSAEMHERLHGLASDILIECHASGGMPNPEGTLTEIKKVCGDEIVGSSASVHVPGMLGIEFNGQLITRHVNFVGLDPETYDQVSHFGRYLLHPANQTQVSFDLRENGVCPRSRAVSAFGLDTTVADTSRLRKTSRNRTSTRSKRCRRPDRKSKNVVKRPGPRSGFMAPSELLAETDGESAAEFDPAHANSIPASFWESRPAASKQRDADNNVRDHYYCRPGDDVRMMFPNASENTKVVNQKFTVVDMYESGMSEYDSTFAFCRLDQLQRLSRDDRSRNGDPQRDHDSIETCRRCRPERGPRCSAPTFSAS